MRKIILVLIITISFTFSTGCTSDFELNDVVVKDISDKITKAVKENVDSNIKSERHDMRIVDSKNLNEININSKVGDIEIISHDSNETVIDINIKAKTKTKERAEQLTKSFEYLVDANGKKLNIDTTGYKEKTNNEQIIVDLVIKIPSDIKKFEIKSNVGDINIENISGEIEIILNVGDTIIKNSNASCFIKADVGDINIHNSSITNSSSFYSNVGDIHVITNDISTAKNLSVETNVGDIELSLPKISSYEANIQEFMKETKVESVGTGKTKIKLITHIGNIDFE